MVKHHFLLDIDRSLGCNIKADISCNMLHYLLMNVLMSSLKFGKEVTFIVFFHGEIGKFPP